MKTMGCVLLALLCLPAGGAETNAVEVSHTETRGLTPSQLTSLKLTLNPSKTFRLEGFASDGRKATEGTTTLGSTLTVAKTLSLTGGYTRRQTPGTAPGEQTDLKMALHMGGLGDLTGSRLENRLPDRQSVAYGLTYKAGTTDRFRVLLDAKLTEQGGTGTVERRDTSVTATVRAEF